MSSLGFNKHLLPKNTDVLFSGTPTNLAITLTKSAVNYNQIIIIYRQRDTYGSVSVINPNNRKAICNITKIDSNQIRTFGSSWLISGTNITPSNYFWCQTGSTAFDIGVNYIEIVSVLGIK